MFNKFLIIVPQTEYHQINISICHVILCILTIKYQSIYIYSKHQINNEIIEIKINNHESINRYQSVKISK